MAAVLERIIERKREEVAERSSRVPLAALGEWTPTPNRPNVVDIMERSHEGRLQWLLE